MLGALSALAYVLHVGGGAVAFISGMVALFAPKGGRLHRRAGNLFFLSMGVMAAFALYLAVTIPDPVNIFIAIFTFYLVATAWLTVRRGEETAGVAEKIGLLVALSLCAPFAILSFQLAAGLKPLFRSTVPLQGPVLIAIYAFTLVLALAMIGDVRLVLEGGVAGARRIARHLWRMCLGLTLATGSAFTNGLSRLLPGPHHVPAAFFLPQLVPLAMLIFWLVRVRFTGWYEHGCDAAIPERQTRLRPPLTTFPGDGVSIETLS
jgi:uncharacterized membrane protein